MNERLSMAISLGFVLGLKHATDADHLVAVTTMVTEHRSLLRPAWVGVLWGVGHTASLLVAGGVVILLQAAIPERVAALLECVVALMIIFLGSRILYLLLRGQRQAHVHTHTHSGRMHSNLHFHRR
jgi:high-affinity nickel permease